MATLVIKSNAGTGADVLIADVGIFIPLGGGQDTFTSNDELVELQESRNLRTLLTDDAFGAGSSTLILNDGTADIDQADAENFLDTLILPDASNDFGVVKNNADGEVDDNVTFDGTATITGLPTPVNASDAANKQYVDDRTSGFRTWKELILVTEQLDSVNDAISQAIPFWLDNNAAEGDTLVITDGTTTETFTFTATPAVAFDVEIGADALETMDNLTTTINTDSTLWSAVTEDALDQLNARVVAIYRTDNSAQDSYDDRIYGTFTTPADVQYVSFEGLLDYTSSVSAQLPGADPAVKTFGFGRATATLQPSETHVTRDEDTIYVWDADAGVWQNSGANNPALQDSRYVGKWITFGSNLSVPLGGVRFLKSAGNVATSAAGLYLPRNGVITAATLQVDTAPTSNNYKLSIKINGTEVASLSLPNGNDTAASTALNVSYNAGDELSLSMERVGGIALGSAFDNVVALVEVNEVLAIV